VDNIQLTGRMLMLLDPQLEMMGEFELKLQYLPYELEEDVVVPANAYLGSYPMRNGRNYTWRRI
jgi:hypothetical protein